SKVPSLSCQPATSAAREVTAHTRSYGESVRPHLSFTRLATFSSSSRFLLPLGDQSLPMASLTPLPARCPTSWVSPYSTRLLSGDQTTLAPASAKALRSSAVSARAWTAASDLRRSSCSCRFTKCCREEASTPSDRW